MHIAGGQTKPGETDWKEYAGGSSGIYVDVDTSSAQFAKTPYYVTSLGGSSSHWAMTGASSVYDATPTGFRIYVRWADGRPLTPREANEWKWHVNWIGFEE